MIEADKKSVFFIGSSGPDKKWETTQEMLVNRKSGGDDMVKWLDE